MQLLYTLKRAIERRVFYVDVGNMPICYAVCGACKDRNTIKDVFSKTGGGTNVQL